jgi:tryptophan synthase alpha chain
MTQERIDRCFRELAARRRTALVAYLTVGDPSVSDTLSCALAAIDAGADLLEIGVPFSDPTADGPVIAAASYRAIHNGGSLRAALEVARSIRQTRDVPLVLFTYYNPIVAFGEQKLPSAARAAGCDGLLVVDLPPEEGAELRASAKQEELAVIPLVAPTTGPDREALLFAGAQGFVYYVSLTGVTGSGAAPLADAGRHAAGLRERARLPVVVGFGIDTPDKARRVAAEGVDGVAVGTAIVKTIAGQSTTEGRVRAVHDLVASLRRGLDARE